MKNGIFSISGWLAGYLPSRSRHTSAFYHPIFLNSQEVHPVSSPLTTLRPGSHQFPLAHKCRPAVPKSVNAAPLKLLQRLNIKNCKCSQWISNGFGWMIFQTHSQKNVSQSDEIQVHTATVAPCASKSLKILAGHPPNFSASGQCTA